MKKNLLLLCLFATPVMHCMSVERIKPDASILAVLKKFHEATGSGYNSKKPSMKDFQEPKRRFVAKMDSFGLDRYFSFKTDEDVNELVKAVQQGGGWKVEWFYYDQEESQCTVSAQKTVPNVIVLSDDKQDQ